MTNKLLKFLLYAAVLLLAVPLQAQLKAPTLENLRINGMLMYDDNRSEDVLGFYEYTATNPVCRKVLKLSPRNYLAGDAVVVDGKLYTYHLDVQYEFVNSAFYTVIDVATGEASKSSNISWELGPAYSHYAKSAALNPMDGKVYCSGFEYNEDNKTLTPTLKIWNVTANSKESVGTMQASLAVMSFDKDGNLYGITASSSDTSDDGGRLVKVNTTTGDLTLVGDTGVRPKFDQSGVISPFDGRLYWFATERMVGGGANDAYARLYVVDLATAKAECIGDMPNGDEVVAAWIPAQTIDDNAPGVVHGLSAVFTAPALTGNVKFTLPDKTYSGSNLEGELEWTVSASDKILAQGKAASGSDVDAEVTVESSGEYTFEVIAANQAGKSVAAQTSTYIGYGVPKPVGDVKFTVEDGRHVVTWEHVTTLDKGEYLDGTHAAYRVVRYPEAVVLHEKLTDNRFEEPALDGAIQSTYYEITAVNGDRSAAPAKSNVIVTGSSVELPYSEDFSDEASFGLFSTIDGNKDNSTWYYSSKSVKIRQTTAGNQDDWLVLPPVQLEEGYSYEMKFNCYATQTKNINILDVAMGISPEAESMTELLLADVEVANTTSRAMKEVSLTIKPKTSAKYRIGLHLKSAKMQGTFTIDDISLSAGRSTAIPAAPAIGAVAAGKGALEATISITAPTLTAGGAELTKPLTGFEILRDGTTVKEIDAVPGVSDYSYKDNTIKSAGIYTYSVYAVNADGNGEIAETTIYIGRDVPAALAGLTATDNFDGTVTLTWDEPSEIGVNGGYVDVAHLVYTATTPDNSLVENIKGTSAVLPIEKTGEQKEVKYTLGVKYDDVSAMECLTAESNSLVAGAPYSLPFAENFADASFASKIWTKNPIEPAKSSSFNFMTSADSDHGGNGGGLKIFAYDDNSIGRWISPVIDLSANVSPEISLWLGMSSADIVFELQIREAYGEWKTVKVVEPVSQWTEIKANLSDFRSPFVRLGFVAQFSKSFNGMYIDDINIHDLSSGIDSITADDGEAEIYNLQGMRVSDTAAPGVYIMRKGGTVKKVIIP